MPTVDNPSQPEPTPPQPDNPEAATAAWQDLLAELTELHARLEYMRLLLKLGVRGF